MEALFFWLFSVGMIVSGLAVILSRNAVASALCFAASIIFMAALFVMLNAFFLAAVQILVTAGAVMVLFLFIIMLLDLTAMEHIPRPKIWMTLAGILALGFLYIVARTLNATPEGFATTSSVTATADQQSIAAGATDHTAPMDDIHQIGHLLFSTYVAPFEVTSLLILVATVGVIVLCQQDKTRRPSPNESIMHEAPPLEAKKEPVLKI
ncbi:MAG: NADH-quinone oxidoreductase subunit J [Methylacidiphilales bacterium]|nr:NADH-quinone oxidoreductase subunit J [Candidatus Methylacidiphilales bacterium]